MRADACDAVLRRVHDELAERGLLSDEGYLDGKARPVGPVSKHRQATCGKVSGGFAKGYKPHAFVTERRRIAAWSVTGLTVAERGVAAALLPHAAARLTADAVVMLDGNYDPAPLAAQGGRRPAGRVPAAPAEGPAAGRPRRAPPGDAAADGRAARRGASWCGAGTSGRTRRAPRAEGAGRGRAGVRRADAHGRRAGAAAGVGPHAAARAAVGRREEDPVRRPAQGAGGPGTTATDGRGVRA
ncbi:MAG: hypothetical protein AVDCRST_MAG64-3510 [uncultured Phycisphaerae bacterium]|uniref:Uncharacterized protein n=1 Tax=uncultured Phycisphaerae bacterium TaxID=904963 RepID=A0A6J4Q5H7_9BACT|nr:MAG: hypothetical protein AVDCRST_MAG64-3510 [uncultured Phycisphaerae bacterium]